ncbi:MAG TPA: hypothetical protein VGR53_08845 [Nitrososphaerales archaeon]|nr:hypothetical protein [Nitrososphaerales archaeon]
MIAQKTRYGELTRTDESVLLVGMSALIFGGLFVAEGLLGYFYNYSIFWEGLDHIAEICSGIAFTLLGLVSSAYIYLRS